MKKVGFMGGSSLVETGSAHEMDIFFARIRTSTVKGEKEVLERLYNKYIKIEQLDALSEIVKRASTNTLPYGDIELEKYFKALILCIESARIFHKEWGIYQPVKIGFTDIPYCITDKNRPLDEYDNLKKGDLPFWQRA